MDKKLIKTVLSVILGIAVFTLTAAAFSMLFDAALAKDVIKITSPSESVEKVVYYMRDTSIALVCTIVPALVCFFFAYFSKSKKIFATASAVLALAVAVFSIAFLFDLRSIVLKDMSATAYTAAAEYFANLIQLAVTGLIVCAYFTVTAVCAFRKKEKPAETVETETNTEEATHEEV